MTVGHARISKASTASARRSSWRALSIRLSAPIRGQSPNLTNRNRELRFDTLLHRSSDEEPVRAARTERCCGHTSQKRRQMPQYRSRGFQLRQVADARQGFEGRMADPVVESPSSRQRYPGVILAP